MQILQLLADNGGAFQTGIFAGSVGLLFLIIALLLSIFWIWMLIDCLTSSMPSTEKLIWFLVIFFLHILGAVLYYVIQRGDGNRHAMT
jgi:hypothetical protein